MAPLHVQFLSGYASHDSRQARAARTEVLRSTPPGLTELHLRPAVDSSELRAFDAEWTSRVAEYQLLTGDAELDALLNGVRLIGYRELRDAQRRLR